MSRLRSIGFASLALVAALVVASVADARPGSGGSFGSRGTRTFSPPAATRTAPNTAAPMERSVTQPTRPGVTQPAPAGGGFFGRPGFVGGLFAGFLGAGLLGMLFGGGLFGGLGGFASILGLLLQIALVVIVARLIWAWWQRRNAPVTAGGPPLHDVTSERSALGGLGGGGFGSGAAALVSIKPADYDDFERLLKEVTLAYAASDLSRLRTLATPEMVSYFADDLARYAGRGLTNEVGDITLEQGDLAEAWSEGQDEYATVAMRYRLKDAWVDVAGRVVEGSREPQDVTELWTFRRPSGGHWLLSAIQQAR